MSWWLLLLIVFLAWCLWALAAMGHIAVENARKNTPEEKRRGFSIAPVIPLFPLAFFGLAKLADVFVAPWGTLVTAGLHLLFGLLCLMGVARYALQLRSINRLR